MLREKVKQRRPPHNFVYLFYGLSRSVDVDDFHVKAFAFIMEVKNYVMKKLLG